MLIFLARSYRFEVNVDVGRHVVCPHVVFEGLNRGVELALVGYARRVLSKEVTPIRHLNSIVANVEMGLDGALGGIAINKFVLRTPQLVFANIDGQRVANVFPAQIDAVDGDVLPVEVCPVDMLGHQSIDVVEGHDARERVAADEPIAAAIVAAVVKPLVNLLGILERRIGTVRAASVVEHPCVLAQHLRLIVTSQSTVGVAIVLVSVKRGLDIGFLAACAVAPVVLGPHLVVAARRRQRGRLVLGVLPLMAIEAPQQPVVKLERRGRLERIGIKPADDDDLAAHFFERWHVIAGPNLAA